MPDSTESENPLPEDVSDLEEAGREVLEGQKDISPEQRARSRERLTAQRSDAVESDEVSETASSESERSDLTPEEAESKAERLAEKKAKIAQILDRGILNDKLRKLVDALPSDRKGIMVRDRPEDIDRIRALGGRIERREDLEGDVSGVHGTGDGKLLVGDVVLMSFDRETAEVIDLVQKDNVEKKLKRGRREYSEKAARNQEVPIIDQSHQRRG